LCSHQHYYKLYQVLVPLNPGVSFRLKEHKAESTASTDIAPRIRSSRVVFLFITMITPIHTHYTRAFPSYYVSKPHCTYNTTVAHFTPFIFITVRPRTAFLTWWQVWQPLKGMMPRFNLRAAVRRQSLLQLSGTKGSATRNK
jgi:hypothetical protein